MELYNYFLNILILLAPWAPTELKFSKIDIVIWIFVKVQVAALVIPEEIEQPRPESSARDGKQFYKIEKWN